MNKIDKMQMRLESFTDLSDKIYYNVDNVDITIMRTFVYFAVSNVIRFHVLIPMENEINREIKN